VTRATVGIRLGEDEIRERFVRSPGPGGQNVNKVATAVQLRFDVRNSPSLADDVRERLIRLAGKRVTREGILVIEASRYRTRERNRRDARERLSEWLRQAARPPVPRRETRPTRESKARRLAEKVRHGEVKRARKAVLPTDS
jgi:ribosome-associated protein